MPSSLIIKSEKSEAGTRKGASQRCSTCGGSGHKSRMCKASAPEEGDPFSQFLSLQADCASSNDEEVSWDSWAGQTGEKRQRTESIQRT